MRKITVDIPNKGTKKTYGIYMKSHCEAPDYEDWCEASSKKEAVDILYDRINKPQVVTFTDGSGEVVGGDWDRKEVEKMVFEER